MISSAHASVAHAAAGHHAGHARSMAASKSSKPIHLAIKAARAREAQFAKGTENTKKTHHHTPSVAPHGNSIGDSRHGIIVAQHARLVEANNPNMPAPAGADPSSTTTEPGFVVSLNSGQIATVYQQTQNLGVGSHVSLMPSGAAETLTGDPVSQGAQAAQQA